MSTDTKDSLRSKDNADWLESLLRASQPAPIADDGFSARVMQRLPVQMTAAQVQIELQRSARQDRRFEWFSLIGAVVGGAMALWGGAWPSADALAAAIMALVEFKPVASSVLAPWLASLFSAGVLAYVMQRS